MEKNQFDNSAFQSFLDIGGPDMRAELLTQVQSDLRRCLDVLTTATDTAGTAKDRAELCKIAHEIKGIALTIGANELADCALKAETACARHDVVALAGALALLAQRTRSTMALITDLTRAA